MSGRSRIRIRLKHVIKPPHEEEVRKILSTPFEDRSEAHWVMLTADAKRVLRKPVGERTEQSIEVLGQVLRHIHSLPERDMSHYEHEILGMRFVERKAQFEAEGFAAQALHAGALAATEFQMAHDFDAASAERTRVIASYRAGSRVTEDMMVQHSSKVPRTSEENSKYWILGDKSIVIKFAYGRMVTLYQTESKIDFETVNAKQVYKFQPGPLVQGEWQLSIKNDGAWGNEHVGLVGDVRLEGRVLVTADVRVSARGNLLSKSIGGMVHPEGTLEYLDPKSAKIVQNSTDTDLVAVFRAKLWRGGKPGAK